jgi:hypothetical protein
MDLDLLICFVHHAKTAQGLNSEGDGAVVLHKVA